MRCRLKVVITCALASRSRVLVPVKDSIRYALDVAYRVLDLAIGDPLAGAVARGRGEWTPGTVVVTTG
jgi:hypothetical protein